MQVRILTFAAASISIMVAAEITRRSHGFSYQYYQYDIREYSKKTRIITWCISIVLCIATILEIIFTNYNEWTLMKVATCFCAWFAFLEKFYEESFYYEQDKLTDVICTIAKFVMCISLIAAIVGFFYGVSYEHPAWQETQRLSTTELVAANDSYQVEGRGSSGLFIHSFAISENGVYRYYYRTEDGGIKQNYVDAQKTTIYYIEVGETPHLDKVGLFKYWYRRSNNQDVLDSSIISTWYELYVPTGSVVESYSFDLQ